MTISPSATCPFRSRQRSIRNRNPTWYWYVMPTSPTARASLTPKRAVIILEAISRLGRGSLCCGDNSYQRLAST
ncbi:hypothetical protein L596_029686 [Steinernema carpocapsae]|uniref:Uncharacterized protein n=1 Tax=Steinernema carpocapsae TaxID=34508 RepID=A0A4U5LQH7_STECR|nr:hypothetical protein L596_029686 [Steinernema carpocapsae]